uniref:Ig-like domain-containing protein n=1 Tax=Panagrolaimus sp. JU765 TaxID=591449 RepID=A0AC34RMZ2_9BILA
MKLIVVIFICTLFFGIVYSSSGCTSCATIAVTFDINFNPGVTTFEPTKNSKNCTIVKVTCSATRPNDTVLFYWYDLNDRDIGTSGQGSIGSTSKTLVCKDNGIFTLDEYPVSRAECLIE